MIVNNEAEVGRNKRQSKGAPLRTKLREAIPKTAL